MPSLGSTGSIGTQTLEVAASCGHRVLALTAHHNIDLLERQARTFHPYPGSGSGSNRRRCFGVPAGRHGHSGPGGGGGVLAAAQLPQADTAVTALVGIAGLAPTLAAIDTGKRIALANKGDLGVRRALGDGPRPGEGGGDRPRGLGALGHLPESPGQPRPGAETDFAHRLWGPFFGWTREALEKVTPDRALQHPNWSMGAKVTIDSATLMNKGLELLEAMSLFAVPRRRFKF